MKRWSIGAGLALLFLLVLVARAPAHLVGHLVPADSVRLSGYSGTFWDGSASSAAVLTEGGWLQMGRLQWSLSQLYLLLLSPTVQLESQWGRQQFRAHVRMYPTGSLKLANLQSDFSAALIKRWLPVNLKGELSFRAQELKLVDAQAESGRGRLVWRRASWVGTRGSQPLGDYVMDFQIDGPSRVTSRVSTLEGPVQVEGSIALNGRSYAVDATLRNRRGFDPELAAALQLMAAPIEGGYQLKFESEF